MTTMQELYFKMTNMQELYFEMTTMQELYFKGALCAVSCIANNV